MSKKTLKVKLNPKRRFAKDKSANLVPISRRKFVSGTVSAAVGALGVAGAAALSACSADSPSPNIIQQVPQGEIVDAVDVPTNKVDEVLDFEDAPFADYVSLQKSIDLPLGSLVYQVDTANLLVLLPSEENRNDKQLAFLNLDSGHTSVLLSKAIGTSRNNVIFDARSSLQRIIWVEVDLSDYSWVVYCAPINNMAPADVLMIDYGDVNYQPPMLAVCNDKVYWTVMPMATGPAAQEDSFLRAIDFSKDDDEPKTYNVITSHGRMITNPQVTDGIITVVPRVDTEYVYYQLTAIECETDKLVDSVILPQSLRVSEAIYYQDKFSFCIEGIYDYAAGLASFGTYIQQDDDRYLHFLRQPMMPPVFYKDIMFVKSTSAIVGIDRANKKTFVVETPKRCSQFGEALAGVGVQDRLVCTSIRIAEDGVNSEAMMLRIFA